MICAVRLRRSFNRLLLAIVLTVSMAFINGFSALAAPFTPEASAYEVNQINQPIDGHEKFQAKARSERRESQENSSDVKQTERVGNEETKNAFERTTDTVREKLNLDEPLPQSTKDFLNSVKGG